MRCLERNKVSFKYLNYEGKQPVLDENGYKTGEYEPRYSEPVEIRANLSPNTGSTFVEQFGTSIQYDKVIVLDKDENLPIKENTYFIIDNDSVPDYKVKKIAPSLNSILIAISKVDIDYANQGTGA